MKRHWFLCELATAAVALLAFVLAGCLGGGAGDNKKKENVEYRIGVVPKGLTHEFWQSIHRGADRAAADLEKEDGIVVEIVWDGPRKENDAIAQIDIVQNLRNQGVNGLVLAPQHSSQMVPSVRQCVDANIPVVIIDSGLDAKVLEKSPDLIVKYIATDNYHGGWLAAEELMKVLKDKDEPRVILFPYQAGSESTEQREKGFLECVEKLNKERKADKQINIVSKDRYAGATVDTAQKEADTLLNDYRDAGIDGIFAVNESAATGMLNAMRSKTLTGKIHLVGFDSSAPLLQAVRKGEVDGLIVQDPYRMGYLGVWTLVKSLKGFAVNLDYKQLSTGEYYLTKDNIDDDEMKGKFSPEVQAKRTIARPEFPKK